MSTRIPCVALPALLALVACDEQPSQRDPGSPSLAADAGALSPLPGPLGADAAAAGPVVAAMMDAGRSEPVGDALASIDAGLANGAAADAMAPPMIASDAASDAREALSDAGAKTCPGGAALAPGAKSVELMVGGQARSFKLFVPRAYNGSAALPLVVDFHGMLIGELIYELFSEWDDRQEKEGYLLAMPQGIDDAWNVGPCCTQSRAVDDVAFARAIVEYVRSAACVDERRIYATGYSNGGGMSHKLACDAADLFAAVAPSAFDLLEEMECKPARPLSVFIFRGTNDDVVPYAGGASTPPTPYTLPDIHFLGAQKTFERWGQLNGCSGAPSDSAPDCKTYSECRAGVKVTLCTKQAGGHDPVPVDLAWPMLKAFSRP